MNSLKDIQFAQNGEPSQAIIQQEEYAPTPAKTLELVDKSNPDFVVFKLVNNNRKGGVYLPHIDYVIDPRTVTAENKSGNGPEMIRLLNGVTTIWAKEQKDISPEYIKKNARQIHFPRGSRFITLPGWDKAALEFMEVCRHNTQNPLRTSGSKFEFFKYDPDAAAKEMYERELLEIDMVRKADAQPLEKMKKHAFYLGLLLVDELGREKKEDRLRTDYILAAKRDPKRFKESLDSKEVDIQFLVRAAILDSKIDIGRGDGKVYWGSGGGLICNIPKNEDNVRYLTNLALTPNSEGKQFLDQLQNIST